MKPIRVYDDTVTKRYYSTEEISTLVGENVSRIRFWEQAFNLQIKRSKQKRQGIRLMYTQKDLHKLMRIKYLLRVSKYTIEGAKQQMV